MEYILIFNFDSILSRQLLTVDKDVFLGVIYEISKVHTIHKEYLELFDLERYFIIVNGSEIELGFINQIC